ncbi:MAG TPA: hypothetical protein VF748_15380 [Candidatus Acidoferrum sp.]
MQRPATFWAAVLCLGLSWTASYAQDPPPSLGDIARQARKDREKHANKPKTIITEDALASSKSLSRLGDLGSTQPAGDSATLSKALSRLEEAESQLNKLDALDRATLAKAVLMDNDVDFPSRRNWEDRLYTEKQHYVSHERELIVEVKKAAAQVENWKASQDGRKLDPNDPRVQQLKSRVAEIIQDALRTEQDYRAAVMEGWDLAKQARH